MLFGPDPPAELGATMIVTPAFRLVITPMPSLAFIDPVRLDGNGVD